ncbi:MAG: tetratricopeptide repeat protein [Cyanobacteria bacterium SZAS TMP-1]|nr:tetratricopeptide repeat protein [Cyanobacteria bacterium SZAS TMP-1]
MSSNEQSSILAMAEVQALESTAAKAASRGEWSQASHLLLRSLQKRKATSGVAHPSYALVLDKLAETYMQQNKLCEAETTLSEACQILESAYYPEHGSLGPILEHLADCLIRQGKYAEAEPILKRAEEVYVKTLTMENRATLRSFYNLAKLYLLLAKPADAKAVLQTAMKHVDTPLGPVAEFRYQLALADIQLQNISEARQLIKSAIIDFKQRHNCSRVADCLQTYAQSCCASADNIEAARCLNQAEMYRQQAARYTYPGDIFLATLLRA